MILSWTHAQSSGGYDLSEQVVLPKVTPERPLDPVVGPVQVQIHAEVAGGLCVVQGDLETHVTQACVRCLADVDERLHIPFREVLSRSPLTREQEENDVVQIQGDEYDLEPLIGQAIYLSLNPQPLCTPSCKGLCPQCGVNRNQAVCDCDLQMTDPRLDALASLWTEQGDKGSSSS